MATRREQDKRTTRKETTPDVTRELTGRDAPMEEASSGSAGSGASSFGADQTGLTPPAPEYEEEFGLEAEPGSPEDIVTDRVERMRRRAASTTGMEGAKRPRAAASSAERTQEGKGRRDLRVADVMTKRVATIRTEEELEPKVLLGRFRRVRHLPVLDATDKVVGMLTRTDVLEQAVLETGRARVGTLMSGPVRGISGDATLQAAAQVMVRARIHALPVVDVVGRLVGIVTDSDLTSSMAGARLVAPRELGELRVDALMTRNPVTVEAETSLAEAAQALLTAEARHLPVVDPDGRLVGMLSERDLRQWLGTEMGDWSRASQDVLDEPVGNAMRPDPLALPEGAPLSRALAILTDERVGALPVLDDEDRVVGVLSYVDVLLWLRQRARAEGAGREEEAPPLQ